MELLLGAANVLLQRERPLAAAVAATVALREGFDDASPALLATLGTALARSAGVFVRKPFFEHAAKVFVRCKALGDPKYGPIADEWLGQLRAETPVDGIAPHRRDELPELLRFLDVDENYLLEAIDAIPADDQMMVVMALTEAPEPVFAKVLHEGVRGRWGEGPGRSALKRAPRWPADPKLGEALAAAAASPKAEELQPYLGFAQEAYAKAGGSSAPPAPAGGGGWGSAPAGGSSWAAPGAPAAPASGGLFAQASAGLAGGAGPGAAPPPASGGGLFAQAAAGMQPSSAPAPGGNPFAQASAPPSGNPFAQASAPSSGNPFAQASGMGPLSKPKPTPEFPIWRVLLGAVGIAFGLQLAWKAGADRRFSYEELWMGVAIATVCALLYTWAFFSRAKNLAIGVPVIVVLLAIPFYMRVQSSEAEWHREDALLRVAQPVCENGSLLPDAPDSSAAPRSVLVYEGFTDYNGVRWYPWRDGPTSWRPVTQPTFVVCVARPQYGGEANLDIRAARTGQVVYNTKVPSYELYGDSFDRLVEREVQPFVDGLR
ncbi:MAG: hypothetical protein R3B99_36720 [Polyangiales bacterium]